MFFEGVEELRAGHVAAHRPRRQRDAPRYWTAGASRRTSDMSYDDAVAGVRERLIRSVELRLRATCRLPFCMSGGVDSNALISIAKRVLRNTTCTDSPS